MARHTRSPSYNCLGIYRKRLRGVYSLPYTGMCRSTRQGMVFALSVLHRAHNFAGICYCQHDWFDLLNDFCLYSKGTKALTLHEFALLRLPIMALKQDGVYFIQFVLNKVINWGRFFFVFLKGVRVSKPRQPTYIQNLIEYLRRHETGGTCTLCDGGGDTEGGSEVDCSV